MKEKTGFKERIKKIYPILIIAVCVLAIGGVVLYMTVFNVEEPVNIVDNTPIDTDTEPDDPVDGGNDPVVIPPDPVWTLPVVDYTLGMDYSKTEFTFNQTTKEWKTHQAVDFLVGDKKEVYAVFDGTVESVDTTVLEGTTIVINHGNGIKSYYSSLTTDTAVSVGETVESGDLIGYAGDSGYSEFMEGSHLHFEMTLNGACVDPRKYLDIPTDEA
ncbi:MAG: M23 family metallopeptidase [Clostridia bacterium]|nr:M23 family metallopeptidase [Clostridia bacterium]